MKWQGILLLVALALALGGCPAQAPTSSNPAGTTPVPAATAASPCAVPEVDQPLADFSFTTLTGEKVQFSSLKGKVVVADFWATLCTGCIDELKHYQADPALMNNPQVQIVAFCMDKSEAAVRGFVKQKGFTFTVALATDPVRQALGTSGQVVLPQVRVIDPQGHLRYNLGPDQANVDTVKCLIKELSAKGK